MELQVAHNFCEDTILLKNKIETNFIELGARLQKIRDEGLYKPRESFYDFLLEMKLTESTASKLISVYKKFVLDFKLSKEDIVNAGGWTIVYQIGKISKTKEEATEWLEKSKLLSRRDIEIELHEHKSGLPQEKCSHRNSYEMKVCRDCGFKQRIDENNSF